jgi:hypothetical protein
MDIMALQKQPRPSVFAAADVNAPSTHDGQAASGQPCAAW